MLVRVRAAVVAGLYRQSPPPTNLAPSLPRGASRHLSVASAEDNRDEPAGGITATGSRKPSVRQRLGDGNLNVGDLRPRQVEDERFGGHQPLKYPQPQVGKIAHCEDY